MKVSSKDGQILFHIVEYCNDVELTIRRFGKSKSNFMQDTVYLNACSMPILQIGELAKKLSDDFITKSTDIPWKRIKGMRDYFVHDYHSMDKEVIWDTATKNIPILKKQCINILKENHMELPTVKEKQRINRR